MIAVGLLPQLNTLVHTEPMLLIDDGHTQPVEVQFQIERDTGLVTRMDFATTGEEGVTLWALQLSEFGEPVSISPPEGS